MGAYDSQVNKAWKATVRTSPTPSGYLEAYNSLLTNGMTYATMVEQFITQGEIESNVRPISRLYQAMFRRKPDSGGLDNWVQSLIANRAQLGSQTSALEVIATTLVGSTEYQIVYPNTSSNSTFITLLYENILVRAPDAAGHAAWTAALDNGSTTRAKVLVAFSESQEFVNRTFANINSMLRAAAMDDPSAYVGNLL